MINVARFLRLFFSFPKLMMNPESVAALVLNRTTMTPVIQKSVSKSVPKKIPMDWLVVIRGTPKPFQPETEHTKHFQLTQLSFFHLNSDKLKDSLKGGISLSSDMKGSYMNNQNVTVGLEYGVCQIFRWIPIKDILYVIIRSISRKFESNCLLCILF